MGERDRSADVDPVAVVEDAVHEALTGPRSSEGDRHLLGDLVLDPAFTASVRWRLVSHDLLPAWQRLSQALPAHARPRCTEMVMWCAATPEVPDAAGESSMSRRRVQKRSTIRRADPSQSAWGEHEPWVRAMFQLQEAEARGDAAEGLGITDAFQFALDGKPFWSAERIDELHLIAQWGPVLPGWAWSRWVCNQAARVMHDELRDPSLDAERRAGLHAASDQLWAYRQLRLYDDGVLRFFVRRIAGSALLARSDQVEAWPRATMGGFEFIGADPVSISWLDLAEREVFSTPNIGSAVLFLPGDCVIGRLVPTEGGRMFESRPLGVPPGVAQEVAEAPTRWSELLRAARPGGGHGLVHDPRPRESLVTDVLPPVWQLAVPTLGLSQERPRERCWTVSTACWTARSVPAQGAPTHGRAWARRCSSRTSGRCCRPSSGPLTAICSRCSAGSSPNRRPRSAVRRWSCSSTPLEPTTNLWW